MSDLPEKELSWLGKRQSRRGFVALCGKAVTALGLATEATLDACQPRVKSPSVDINQRDIDAALGSNLSDPGSHQSRSHDSDAADLHCQPLDLRYLSTVWANRC